jgi:quercetin dioxygenase-like cupin family protein
MKLFKFIALTCISIASQYVQADEDRKHYYTDIPGVEANVLIKTTKSWNGTTLPVYGDGQPEISIVRYRFAPGASIPMHMHPVINAGVLLSGELSITTKSGEAIVVKAGEPLVELFREWHSGSNSGSEPADLVVVYAGTFGIPLVIREK